MLGFYLLVIYLLLLAIKLKHAASEVIDPKLQMKCGGLVCASNN